MSHNTMFIRKFNTLDIHQEPIIEYNNKNMTPMSVTFEIKESSHIKRIFKRNDSNNRQVIVKGAVWFSRIYLL